jgi:hypothetical protein
MDLLTTYCPTVVDFVIPLFRLRENWGTFEEEGCRREEAREEARARGAALATGLADALDAARGVYLDLATFLTRMVPCFGAAPRTLLLPLP